MRRHWIVRGLKFVLFAAIACAVFGLIVLSLWNCLITFWQALGLFILSKILFGGFRGRPGYRMHWRRRMAERWQQMTPEEREKFRQGMRRGCGPFREPAAESGASAKT
jgi:hypothetical protein